MTTRERKEHRATVADVRNVFGEVLARSRYGGEMTVVMNRSAEAAAIVPMEFYRRALEALGETVVPAEPPTT
ncbi:type II toxin-antitoxin system prevent-host-death family antitoxin [Streptomyces rubiginosohelvolus]|uniref:type II toxin-antitoxin system prevent-host-death family antitoxin n=1 Tax=Streptomyces rubiginosohelvolus TaxID=67362 RepID=UPI003802D8B6